MRSGGLGGVRAESGGVPIITHLADAACTRFRQRLHRAPSFVAAAPGRVNVIGEHTDYNGGFVLPMAIDRYVVIAAARRDDGRVRVYSALTGEETEWRAGEASENELPWARYVRGVLEFGVGAGLEPGGFDAVIESNLPPGAGLSSSAALEVATATLAEALSGCVLPPIEKALLCQHAEHEYAGVPCGIMDQAVSVMGRDGHLMLLDCRSLETKHIPIENPALAFLVSNTKVRHDLADGEYAQRRRDCEIAAQALGVVALRNATSGDLERLSDPELAIAKRRARHVIGENARTLDAVAALERGDCSATGALMYASHESLRDDYEVSCAELDLIVEIAREIGAAGGVHGCRMTGAGFGGSTLSLIETARAPEIIETICERYHKATGIEPEQFITRPVDGGRILSHGED